MSKEQGSQATSISNTVLAAGGGAIAVIILLAILFFSGIISFNVEPTITPEPPAVVQATPTVPDMPLTSTPTQTLAPAEPGATSTPVPTVTPSPSRDDALILPTPTCDTSNITIQDFGCVESDRDTVQITQNNVLQPLERAIPRYLNENDQLEVNDGKAIFSFFGGKLHVENGSQLQLVDAGGVAGVILFLFNRGSLVGEFEGGERALVFELVNGATVEITGTQFFIDLNTDVDYSGTQDDGEDGEKRPRVIIGNIQGSVSVNGQRLPGGNLFLLDDEGEIIQPNSVISDDPLDWTAQMDSSFDEIDQLNQTAYLVALQEMNVRTGPTPRYGTVGILPEGGFAEILGYYDPRPTNRWWKIRCEQASLDGGFVPQECWVWGHEDFTYAINTDTGVAEQQPLLPEPTHTATPTPSPTNTPTLTSTPAETATGTPIFTPTPTPTFTPTFTPTPSPPPTETHTPAPSMLLLPQPLAPLNGEDLFYPGCGFEEPVVLSWTAVANATSYQVQGVEWSESGTWVADPKLTIVTSDTTAFHMPQGCTTYCWQVQASAVGFEPSGYSNYSRYRVDGFDESPPNQPSSCP